MLNYADLNLNQSGQYGQIYAEKFTSASLICKVFYGKMKAQWGRETHFIPNGVNRPQIRETSLITDKFGLKKDSYILFLGRLVPEKGIRYLVEAFKNVKTDKKLVIAGGSSDTDSFMEELKELEANGLAAGKDHQFKGRYDAEKNAVIISLEKDEQSALSPQKCTT